MVAYMTTRKVRSQWVVYAVHYGGTVDHYQFKTKREAMAFVEARS